MRSRRWNPEEGGSCDDDLPSWNDDPPAGEGWGKYSCPTGWKDVRGGGDYGGYPNDGNSCEYSDGGDYDNYSDGRRRGLVAYTVRKIGSRLRETLSVRRNRRFIGAVACLAFAFGAGTQVSEAGTDGVGENQVVASYFKSAANPDAIQYRIFKDDEYTSSKDGVATVRIEALAKDKKGALYDKDQQNKCRADFDKDAKALKEQIESNKSRYLPGDTKNTKEVIPVLKGNNGAPDNTLADGMCK